MTVFFKNILFVCIASVASAEVIDMTHRIGGDASQENDTSSTETDEVVVNESDLITSLVNQVVAEDKKVDPAQIEDDGKFEYLKFNDLRDVSRHDKNLRGTSFHILKTLERDPFAFTEDESVRFYVKKNNEISAMGPYGHKAKNSKGKSYYKVTNNRAERRKNVVIGISYERVVDVTGEDKVFNADLLLFIHSDAKGYYFRKINVDVTWKEKVEGLAKVTVRPGAVEVSLSETDFEVHVELATQKTVVYDKNHGITRVIPITSGAIAAREAIDGKTNSMTLLLPGASGKFKDFNFNESVLIKREYWDNRVNTDSRVLPSYYKGRPFIGIIDRAMVEAYRYDEDSNSYVLREVEIVDENAAKVVPPPAVEPLVRKEKMKPVYDQGYRQIGFHYQIKDRLKRSFKSHGCLRTQDHDLYFIHDIVNYGPKDMVPIEVKMSLSGKYQDIDSMYPRDKDYKKVVYGRGKSPRTIRCKNKASYPVRFFDGGYHTIADSDCLSQVAYEKRESLRDAVDFFMGQSTTEPRTISWGAAEHIPIKKRKEFIGEHLFVLSQIGFAGEINSLNQGEQIKLVDQIKAFKAQNPDYENTNNSSGLLEIILDEVRIEPIQESPRVEQKAKPPKGTVRREDGFNWKID